MIGHYTVPLRAVIDRTGVEALSHMTAQPGVRAVYRITTSYPGGRARNSVATLRYTVIDDLRLDVVYAGLFGHRPLTVTIKRERYDALVAALLKAGFDKLRDQEGLSPYIEDTWLVERAAGSFKKSVVLTPNRAEMPYSMIVNAIDAYLPEAIREIK